MQDPAIVTWMLLLQGFWGIFLVTLTWAMRRILKDIEENTKATTSVAKSVNDINILLSGNYITRSDFDRLEARIRDAEARVIELRTIVSLRTEMVKP